jgi:hypothetical protein
MKKNVYEILDEFKLATTELERGQCLARNNSQTLQNVLKLTFDPKFEFLVKEMPSNYKTPDTLPGMSMSSLDLEIRRLYLFRKGDATAEKLTEKRRNDLFVRLVETLEPRESDVVLGIMNKDLKIEHLNKKLIDKVFPGLI